MADPGFLERRGAASATPSIRDCYSKKFTKVNHTPLRECRAGVHLPFLGLEPVGEEPLMSVTCGQCDDRPITFPAARRHRPLAGTKLYCLLTEAHMC